MGLDDAQAWRPDRLEYDLEVTAPTPDRNRVVPGGHAGPVRRIASRYPGREAGAAYADRADDDLLIRLEPSELRAWDFAGELP